MHDDGAVIGAAMRTHDVPHAAFLLPMSDEAAVRLAGELRGRGEELTGVSGALPAARACADELGRLTGTRAEVVMRTRLHELGDLVLPPEPGGHLRRAQAADAELCTGWFARFHAEADAQAGRVGHAADVLDESEVRRRVDAGLVWVWEGPDGDVVHLTGCSKPAFGVARIGPVYTPPEQRGHGYAAAAVAQVSQDVLAGGSRVCLYTDLDNPVSNALYARLGYRPVVDHVNLRLKS